MKKLLVFIVVLCISSLGLYAQVEVVADGRLQTILEKHVEYNRMAQTTKGFRIKVATYTGEGAKDKAFELKSSLLEAYPRLRSYVIFDEPYFIVKIGDFTTKLDAYSTFSELKKQVPTALIIQDYINMPIINEEDLLTPEYYEDELENE